MKIAFDLRRIMNPGIGRYMKDLVETILAQDSAGDYLLILPPGAEDRIQTTGSKARIIAPRIKYYSIQEQVQLPWVLRRHRVDLLHATHFMLPLVRPCPSVVTIHDVIPLIWKDDLGSRAGQMYYHAMVYAATRLADRIITDSNFSKNDIVQRLGVNPEKISVIYPGISPEFRPVSDGAQLGILRSQHRIANEYIVYAGIYKPRKNHSALLRAFQRFLARESHANLVVVGPLKEGEQELRRLAEELGISSKVIFTGFVTDDELRTLYSAARVYACPSLYEGFGFTVLEAMACGAPAVCARETSLPEVAGDAAFYADPRNPEEFSEALYQVFTNAGLRDALIEKGRKNVQRFSWANAARQTLVVYQDALLPARRPVRSGTAYPLKSINPD